MRKRLVWMLGLLWAVLSTANAIAQDSKLQFTHLTVENGLSHNCVRAILRDHKGFMWFATENGLNRYDGYSFRVYQHDPKDSTSLSTNRLACLLEDSQKRFWIGTTNGGLSRLDRENDRFIRYGSNTKNPNNLAGSEVCTVFEDRRGVLWVGSSVGLFRLDDVKNRFLQFGREPGESGALLESSVRSICEGLDGSLWIATMNGLFRLHPNRRHVDGFFQDTHNPQGLGRNELRAAVADTLGRIWIGTYGSGLNCYNPATGVWNRYAYDPKKTDGIGYDRILCMCLDNDRVMLVIGTENGGLNVMDLKTRRSKWYLPDLGDPASISSNSVWSVHCDGRKNLWVGTFNGGVNLSSPYLQRFTATTAQPGGLNNPYILSILKDRKGDLWIGTDGGGLNHLDSRSGRWTHYLHDPNDSSSICSNAVLSVFEDRQGGLWMGTWAGGLDKLDRAMGRFIHYRKRFLDWDVSGKENIALVTEDKNGNLIAATYAGLHILDRLRDLFIPYETKYRIEGLVTSLAVCFHQDRQGIVWIGGWRGLISVDLKNRRFTHFQPDSANPNSLSNLSVFCIFEDSRGGIWIGTGGGLDRYNPETRGFKVTITEHGLPSNQIQGILEDGDGNLWISTIKGIAKWTDGVAHPDKPRFRIFDSSDGLPGDEFKYGAALRASSGELFFGGQRGFVSFFPDRIEDNPVPPPVAITGFSIFNRPVPAGAEGSPLKKPISETNELTLTHRQSVLTFEFSALNYIFPQKNRYAYRLEGFEKEWNEVGTRRTATYMNLNHGKYVLRVRASNSDGVWNEEGASFKIRILPPFWKTLWFRGLLFLIFLACAFGAYKWRARERDLAEKRRMDEALAKERNLLRALIDNLPNYIYIKDTESRFLNLNAEMMRKMGIEKLEQIIGKTDFDFLPKEYADPYYANEQAVMRTGQPLLNREESTVDADGNPIWTLTTKMPLRDSQGKVVGLVGISLDITERKRMETALRQSEEAQRAFSERLTRVLEAVNALSQIESFEALCRRSVELAIELLGFDRIGLWFLSEDKRTMLGAYGTDEKGVLRDERSIQGPVDSATVGELLESDDPVVLFERHELRNHEGEVVGTGSQAAAKLWNGEEVIGLLNVDNLMRRNPITGEDQRILYLYAIALAHLFTLKRTETKLKESEERFRALFDQAAVGVAQIETETGRFLKVNRRVCDIVGYSAEELESLTIRDITHSDDLPADLDNMKLLAEGKIREYSADKRFRRKDGSVVWVNQTVSTMSTDKEKQSYEITVVQDITARKQMEDRIRTDIKEKEILLKEIHHRVKNNMQVIVSLLRMQSEQIIDPDIQEKFKASEDRIYSMSLVHEMLYGSKELSKIEFNRYIENLVGNLFESFGADRDRIALELDMEQIELDVYDAIPCGLIVQELVSNVLKYAFPEDWTGESKIRIGLRRADGKVELSVADTGKGMPELDIGKLKSLGFKLVNVLADQLGGDIRVKREKGTEITLRF